MRLFDTVLGGITGGVLVGASLLLAVGCGDGSTGGDDVVQVTILHTSDVHHRATGVGPQASYTPLDTSDDDPVIGGYARLAALIEQIRGEQEAAGIPVLVLDSGDFVVGTVYDMTADDPMALRYMQKAGYDAITLGNHEFDWGPSGLAGLIDAGKAASPAFSVPIVATNLVTDPAATEDDGIEALLADGTIGRQLVLELSNGLSVGILGILGTGGDADAATAPPVTFDHDADTLQAEVDALRADDGAEMVVLLSHSGVLDDGTGEDVTRAGKVSGLDVIASGHEHTATEQAIDAGGTIVFEPGRYGERLARLDITYNRTQGVIESYDYQLLKVDDTVEGDADMEAEVDAATEAIGTKLDAAVGIGVLSPVAELGFELSRAELVETGLGDLNADAYRYAATEAVLGGPDPTPFTVAAVPNGVVRDNLRTTDGVVSFSDLFNVLPLGMSPDPANRDLTGWPLVGVYLTALELQQICLVPARFGAMIGNDVYLHLAGVRCGYDEASPVSSVVNTVDACGDTLPVADGGDGDLYSTSCDTRLDLEDPATLYRLVTDLYTLLLMDMVTGVLDIVPKRADGTILDLSDPADYMATRIDADPDTAGVQEVKSWEALLGFLEAIPDAGGDPALPDIPAAVYGPGGTALGRVQPKAP